MCVCVCVCVFPLRSPHLRVRRQPLSGEYVLHQSVVVGLGHGSK